MPLAVTTVPAVLAALVQLGQTTLAGVTVTDGAPDVDNLPDEFLSVGFSRDEEEPVVSGGLVDAGNLTASESYSIRCMLSVATGDVDGTAVADRRVRCAQLLALFAGALRSDPSLGGVLVPGRASTGAYSWTYGPSAQGGTFCEVEFDVDVTADYLGAS